MAATSALISVEPTSAGRLPPDGRPLPLRHDDLREPARFSIAGRGGPDAANGESNFLSVRAEREGTSTGNTPEFLDAQSFVVYASAIASIRASAKDIRTALRGIEGAVLVGVGSRAAHTDETAKIANDANATFLFLQTQHARDVILVAMPMSLLTRINPYFSELCKDSMGGSPAINDFIAGYVSTALTPKISSSQEIADIRTCARNHLLELIVASLNAESAKRGDQGGWSTIMLRRRVQEKILANLCEPDIGPDRIAKECGISTSYLHKLFHSTGTSVCKWILANRLEICFARLQDPGYRHLSISRIAYDVGFNSPAHFSTRFKEHFGINPGALRARQPRRA